MSPNEPESREFTERELEKMTSKGDIESQKKAFFERNKGHFVPPSEKKK